MSDTPSKPRRFPRTIVDVVAPSVVALGAAEEGFVIAASAKEDPQDLLRVAMTREAARNLARAILDKTDPRPADDETPATNSPASLYDDVEVHDAFAALTERVARLERMSNIRWEMAAETDSETCLHERVMGRIARGNGRPAIEKEIKTDTIYAAVTFPTDDAFVRVGIRTGWNPQEKTGATDARIIAEARQVLAETSTAWPGSRVAS